MESVTPFLFAETGSSDLGTVESMKIVDLKIETRTVDPNPRPKRDALQALPGSGGVTVRVEAEDGSVGTGGASFGRMAGGPDTLAALIEHELKPIVLGSDLRYVRGTHQAMLVETEYHGSAGMATFGVAAVDTALWDCLGKSLDVPCWHLWGRVNERIRAYAMVGWLNFDEVEVQEVCAKAVGQGFRAVKIKVGFETLAEDVARVEVVRKAVGSDVGMLGDALPEGECVRVHFEPCGLVFWL